jgi:hypothetical protein
LREIGFNFWIRSLRLTKRVILSVGRMGVKENSVDNRKKDVDRKSDSSHYMPTERPENYSKVKFIK